MATAMPLHNDHLTGFRWPGIPQSGRLLERTNRFLALVQLD